MKDNYTQELNTLSRALQKRKSATPKHSKLLNSYRRHTPTFSKIQLSLHKKQEQLLDQSSKKERAIFQCELEKKMTKLVNSQVKHFKSKQLSQHSSAMLIQKLVRGFLVRKHYDPIMVHKIQSQNATNVFQLVEQSNHCSIGLGQAIKPYVLLIEDHYARYRVKKKIKRLRWFYNQFMLTQKEKRLNNLKSSICSYACHLRIKAMKFQIYKARRLIEIRQRVAVLAVKKFWRKNKLNFRIIKQRLVKIKRRKAALALKQQQKLERKSEVVSPERRTPEPEVHQSENSDSDDSILRLEMTQQEYKAYIANKKVLKRIRNQKIATAKIAYGLCDHKQASYMPLMHQRALKEDEQDQEPHVLTLTNSLIAKTSFCWPYSRPTTRNTMISEPRKVHSRGGQNGLPPLLSIDAPEIVSPRRRNFVTKEVVNAHFLRRTTAFTNKFKNARGKHRIKATQILDFKHENVLKDTIAFSYKQSQKVKHKKRIEWRPSVTTKHSYTPGLDNMWYIPKHWKRNSKTAHQTNARVGTSPTIQEKSRALSSYSPSKYVPGPEHSLFQLNYFLLDQSRLFQPVYNQYTEQNLSIFYVDFDRIYIYKNFVQNSQHQINGLQL